MPQQIADKFIDALHKLEEGRDLETIVGVFSEKAEVGNVLAPEKFSGQTGAREFWTKYRDTFGEVHSTFRNVITTNNRAALEWTTQGTTSGGTPVKYDGVSILEIEADAVTRFCAYFDAGALGRQVTHEE